MLVDTEMVEKIPDEESLFGRIKLKNGDMYIITFDTKKGIYILYKKGLYYSKILSTKNIRNIVSALIKIERAEDENSNT